MAGKRASMREGPLAALFRRTDEESPEERDEDQAAPAPGPQRGLAAPASPSRARARARTTRSSRSSRLPSSPTGVPSPKERLSAAFAHDIPHDVLERPDRDAARVPSARRAADQPRTGAPAGAARRRRRRRGRERLNRMVEAGVEGVEFIAVNTDLQSLQQSSAHVTLHIGAEITRGLGSGSDPKVGHACRDRRRRPHQEPAEGLRHGLRGRGVRRRHRHRRRAGRGADRARDRRADRRHRDQAVRLRGHAARAPGATTAWPSSPSTSTR